MDSVQIPSSDRPRLPEDLLFKRYISIRDHSKSICEPLACEDFVVQPTREVSPPKWHLAHTSWFFEEVILVPFSKGYARFNEGYSELFNSYYKSAGKHWLQADRGHLSRPTVKEVLEYRRYVDEQIARLLRSSDLLPSIVPLIETGLHHEQQHQELLLMDIKVILGTNPALPAYRQSAMSPGKAATTHWKAFEEGVYETGFNGEGFAYDNECPRHKTYIYPFSIRENTVSNGEFLAFIQDQGYATPKFWLSDGWDWVNAHAITNPLYWQKDGEDWFEFTLHGLKPLDLNAPVTHISYFEADAFANWAGHRLPTEFELELFLNPYSAHPSLKPDSYHPIDTQEAVGQVWCWTRSHYSPYPGYRPFEGILTEYNGKFMCNQFVLKGGSVATPQGHYRHSYRNFFQPQQRWMFSGIRLAKGGS